MSKTGEIPYTWALMEQQIEEAILCQASILAEFGPSSKESIVPEYLGIDPDWYKDHFVEEVSGIDITEHGIYFHAKVAYDYAYQVRDVDSDLALSSWHSVDGLVQGFPETNADGEPSPFCRLNDFPLRRMLETFYARFGLFSGLDAYEHNPSIRELALLSNMTVPAVRTSLSKEGFKLVKAKGMTRGNQEESGFRLDADDAKLWLSRRRGFIPQRNASDPAQIERAVSDLVNDRSLSFPEMVRKVMDLRKLDASSICKDSSLDPTWLSGLIAGQPIAPDVQVLRTLSNALQVTPADFVSSGVRHAMLSEDVA